MRFLDSLKKPLLEMPVYESLIWHEKFYEVGNIEFHYQDFVPSAVLGYLYNTDNGQLAVIEGYETKDDRTTYTGRTLKALLDNKVISSTKVYTSRTAEYIVKDLVGLFAGQGILVEPVLGLQSTNLISVQVTGDNLLDYTDTLLAQYNMGAYLDYDYALSTITYRVVDTIDNRLTKPPLAKNFGTLINNSLSVDYKMSRNYAYVAGEVIAGQPRTVVVVDLRSSPPDEKKELWVDARDLQSTVYINGVSTTLTPAQYQANLRARGIEKLYDLIPEVKVNAEANDKFVLGELRQIKTDGVILEEQIVEVITSYENNSIQQNAVLGTKPTQKA